MPQRVVSDDLKCHIPILRHEGYSVKNICHVLGIRKSMVYSVLKQYHRPRSLNQDDYAFLSAIVDHCRSIYLDELQSELQLKRNIQVTLSTLSHTLQRLGVTQKIISARAYKRNELLRAMYMNQIGKEVPDANMLMFVDEAAKDEHTVFRKYGCSLRGVRCVSQRRFVCGTHYSIIPVLTLDGIIAYDIIEGPVDTERFLKFLKDQVMPFTNLYPGPCSVLVMDNCRIHHGDEVHHLVEEENLCRLIYLPAYSPDYNPIEQAFSAIKSYLRHHSRDSPLMSIVHACQSITPDKAEGYFWASGYIT